MAPTEAMALHDSCSPGRLFCWSETGGTRNDGEGQGGIHLARRLRARPESAQQDEDRRAVRRADARGASDLELRRQLDAPGRGAELALLATAGRALPRPRSHE